MSVICLSLTVLVPHAYGAELLNRTLTLSDSSASATNVTYKINVDLATAGTLGSIEFQFCSNDSFVGDPCTAPAGMDALSAHLASQSGATGFSIAGNSTSNDIIIGRTPAAAVAGTVAYEFSNITNPAAAGSYYVRIITYASSDGSGAATDSGGLAFALNTAVTVSAQVPPYVLFCVATAITNFDCSTASGDYIDLGTFGADHTNDANTELVAASNAQNGYSIYVSGTTLTSGNNVLPAMTGGTSQIGTSQFGLNLAANTTPQVGQTAQGPGLGAPTANYSQTNHYRFTSNDVIATAATADDYRKYTVSYVVNVSHAQAPGVYANTLTYICLANF